VEWFSQFAQNPGSDLRMPVTIWNHGMSRSRLNCSEDWRTYRLVCQFFIQTSFSALIPQSFKCYISYDIDWHFNEHMVGPLCVLCVYPFQTFESKWSWWISDLACHCPIFFHFMDWWHSRSTVFRSHITHIKMTSQYVFLVFSAAMF
jgi:hypothetical protein